MKNFRSGIIIISFITLCLIYIYPNENHYVIYDTHNNYTINLDELVNKIKKYRIISLGEEHNSEKHHALEIYIISSLNDNNSLSQVVMEMIYPNQQIYIDKLYIDKGNQSYIYSPEYLRFLIRWKSDIWLWSSYKEIIEYSFNNDIKLIHGNISTKFIVETPRLTELDSIHSLSKLINTSHLGLGIVSDTKKAKIQSDIDRRLLKNAKLWEGQTVIVAGRHHVRNDIGIGRYTIDSDSYVSIGMINSRAIKAEDLRTFDYTIITFETLFDRFKFFLTRPYQ